MYSEMSKVGYPFLQISLKITFFSKAASKHKYNLKIYDIGHQNFTRSLYLFIFDVVLFKIVTAAKYKLCREYNVFLYLSLPYIILSRDVKHLSTEACRFTLCGPRTFYTETDILYS